MCRALLRNFPPSTDAYFASFVAIGKGKNVLLRARFSSKRLPAIAATPSLRKLGAKWQAVCVSWGTQFTWPTVSLGRASWVIWVILISVSKRQLRVKENCFNFCRTQSLSFRPIHSPQYSCKSYTTSSCSLLANLRFISTRWLPWDRKSKGPA